MQPRLSLRHGSWKIRSTPFTGSNETGRGRVKASPTSNAWFSSGNVTNTSLETAVFVDRVLERLETADVLIRPLAMPQEHAEGCQRWRRAPQLLLAQAEGVVVATAGPGRQAGAVTPRDSCGPQPSHQRSSVMTANPMQRATNEPLALREMPRCGARTRHGKPCQSPSVRGKRRCRMHGGAQGSGAPKGERNGHYRHGLHRRGNSRAPSSEGPDS
jgi:hypothetical protein